MIFVSWIYILVSVIFCRNFVPSVLDICYNQLGDTSQLDISIGIGYILPTIREYVRVGGCLCTLCQRLWAQSGGMYFLKYTYLYWSYTANNLGIIVNWMYIYWYWLSCANNLGICVSWRVSGSSVGENTFHCICVFVFHHLHV